MAVDDFTNAKRTLLANTEQMREHYSSVDLSEKREAIANVVRLVPRGSNGVVGETVGESTEKKKAG